ncbi:hypothetical protein Y032_0192g1365 [Ancylostoma ceylanicum]|uniref:Uncharacterized protein n=1 Tax=Ancylostoma ceylanicum TaxID=53326 RepID=A0A016SQH0_9BILA|nr:hypothetical protein Y032_0192g1365 [Ancylostoma ceylanicum]
MLWQHAKALPIVLCSVLQQKKASDSHFSSYLAFTRFSLNSNVGCLLFGLMRYAERRRSSIPDVACQKHNQIQLQATPCLQHFMIKLAEKLSILRYKRFRSWEKWQERSNFPVEYKEYYIVFHGDYQNWNQVSEANFSEKLGCRKCAFEHFSVFLADPSRLSGVINSSRYCGGCCFQKAAWGESPTKKNLEIPKKNRQKVLVSVSPTAIPLHHGSHVE